MAEQVDQIINKMTGGAETSAQDASTKGNGGGQLMYCDAKSQQELNGFVDSEKPKLVALVGFADYGKSTFIGALYQRLIEKLNYKGYAFVDSETYVGFERRVFLRRVNGEDISDTKRNILKENDILHLKLRSEKGYSHQVLISDKAGETYARYSSSDEEIGRDIVLENADLVVLFVDAEADSKSLAEHNLISEKYESMLSRLKTQKKLSAETSYVVVFTKADKVTAIDRKKKLADRKGLLCKKFAEVLGPEPLEVYEVNSKALDDTALNNVFERIISPKQKVEGPKKIDWVKMAIDRR